MAGTPHQQTEMDDSLAMQVVALVGVGYDPIEVAALTARKVPLMVAGTANSTSVAEQAFILTPPAWIRAPTPKDRDGRLGAGRNGPNGTSARFP
jgi:phosphoglycerate dehydrogenase-like enzyme